MVAKIHTRLCVSGEEGHSLTTIFMGSLIFFVSIDDKVIQQHWLRRKIAQNAQKSYFCCTICLFQHQSKKKFVVSSWATFEQLTLQKAVLIVFYFQQLLSNLLRNYGKPLLKNLEQLVESPRPGTQQTVYSPLYSFKIVEVDPRETEDHAYAKF